ncbi:MAG: HAD hydrolase family protein [Kiritimatiellae bacterium]|nr:HAD hydrolase family protein [Kiritimatiellia bacterium]
MNGFPELFVTDLDLTALGGEFKPYGRFPDPFSEFLDALAERGCRWMINSAWPIDGQWRLVLDSAVRSRPSHLAAEFGLRLAAVTEDGPQKVQPYTSEMEARVAEIARTHLFPLMKDLCARFYPVRIMYREQWLSFFPSNPDKDALREYVEKAYPAGGQLNIFFSKAGDQLSAYPAVMEKGRALAETLRLLGLSADQVVVAGDAIGDLSMMTPELATHVICPQNSSSKVIPVVQARNGIVGAGECALGVIDAFKKLAKKNDWSF